MLSRVKPFFLHLIVGIGMGCTFFVIAGLIINAVGGNLFIAQLTNDYARQALGAIIVGASFGLSSMVYRLKKCFVWQKVIIHMVFGMGVFFLVAFWLKWLPTFSLKAMLITIACILVVSFVIWLIFFLYSKNEARIINERLKKMETGSN